MMIHDITRPRHLVRAILVVGIHGRYEDVPICELRASEMLDFHMRWSMMGCFVCPPWPQEGGCVLCILVVGFARNVGHIEHIVVGLDSRD